MLSIISPLIVFIGLAIGFLWAIWPSQSRPRHDNRDSPITTMAMGMVMFVMVLGVLFLANHVTGGALAAALQS